MRIAVVSDIHGNLAALDAVIADLRTAGADLVVHGGDFMSGGPRPAEVIDRVREMNMVLRLGARSLGPCLLDRVEKLF